MRARRIVVDVGQLSADHALYHAIARERLQLGGLDVFSIAQNRDAIAELENFVHPMRHIENRAAARFQIADDSEKPADLAVGETARRLVEGDDARTARKRFRNLDHLSLGE